MGVDKLETRPENCGPSTFRAIADAQAPGDIATPYQTAVESGGQGMMAADIFPPLDDDLEDEPLITSDGTLAGAGDKKRAIDGLLPQQFTQEFHQGE